MTPTPWPPSVTDVPGGLFADLLPGWCGPVHYAGYDYVLTAHPGGDYCTVARMHTPIDTTMQVSVSRLSLPLDTVEGRHRLCCILAAGVRCPECSSRGANDRGGTGHHVCHGTGYLRPPAPAWHLLPVACGGSLPDALAGHSAGLLACSAWRMRAGMGPIVKVLPEWTRHSGRAEDWARTGANDGRYLHVSAGGSMSGTSWDTERTWVPWWRWRLSSFATHFVTVAEGQESSVEDAKRAADAAALQHGHALLDGPDIRLPWPADPTATGADRGEP